jgi:hypothetical protein
MEALTVTPSSNKSIKRIAQAGFIAKGVVYFLLGVLALMIALRAGGGSTENADKAGVLQMIKEGFGGNWILPLLGVGLLCYAAWRMVETYHQLSAHGKARWKSLRYFFSGLIYLSLAVTALRMSFNQSANNGDNQQHVASEILSKPFGQWLLGILALVIAGIGIYQIYYALSEKYRKHVQKLSLHNSASTALLTAGKIGYTARGVVWLLIAFLLMRAAVHASSSDAGDTSKALELIHDTSYGSYLIAGLGIGLIGYGIFNFVRARYEDFNQSLR